MFTKHHSLRKRSETNLGPVTSAYAMCWEMFCSDIDPRARDAFVLGSRRLYWACEESRAACLAYWNLTTEQRSVVEAFVSDKCRAASPRGCSAATFEAPNSVGIIGQRA